MNGRVPDLTDRVVCCRCWRWMDKDEAEREGGEWFCPKCRKLEHNEDAPDDH